MNGIREVLKQAIEEAVNGLPKPLDSLDDGNWENVCDLNRELGRDDELIETMRAAIAAAAIRLGQRRLREYTIEAERLSDIVKELR